MAYQNPYMDALAQGSQASNQNYQLAQQGFNSTANILNTVGSLSMKMITMLDQEEANKITQLQNQDQILNQAFHNVATERLQTDRNNEQVRADKANEMQNILNSNENARHNLVSEDYQKESLQNQIVQTKNQQKNIEENNAYRNKALNLQKQNMDNTLKQNTLKIKADVISKNINGIQSNITSYTKLLNEARKNYYLYANSDPVQATIAKNNYISYYNKISELQKQLNESNKTLSSLIGINNSSIQSTGSVKQPVNLNVGNTNTQTTNVGNTNTNVGTNQNQVYGVNINRIVNGKGNQPVNLNNVNNTNKSNSSYYKSVSYSVHNDPNGKKVITYTDPNNNAITIQPFNDNGTMTNKMRYEISNVFNSLNDKNIRAKKMTELLTPAISILIGKDVNNMIKNPKTFSSGLSQIINKTNNLSKGIKNNNLSKYVKKLATAKVIIDIAKTIGSSSSYISLPDNERATIADNLNKSINHTIENGRVTNKAPNIYKDSIWKALGYNPVIANEYKKIAFNDSHGTFSGFTKETINNNAYRAAKNQWLISNWTEGLFNDVDLNNFDIDGETFGNVKSRARVFKNTFMDMNTKDGLPTPYVVGVMHHLDHFFSASGMSRNYEIIGKKIYKDIYPKVEKLNKKLSNLQGSETFNNRQLIPGAEQDNNTIQQKINETKQQIDNLKSKIDSPTGKIIDYIKQNFSESEPVGNKKYKINLGNKRSITLTGNELYNIGFNFSFKANILYEIQRDKRNNSSDY